MPLDIRTTLDGHPHSSAPNLASRSGSSAPRAGLVQIGVQSRKMRSSAACPTSGLGPPTCSAKSSSSRTGKGG
eukprot:6806568-Pyramimonas_sp.AAC.1